MIKVCFFSGDITRSGGTERVATLIANELQNNTEYNVSFVSLTEEKENTFYCLDKNIKRYKLYDKPVRGITHYFGYVKRLKKIVKDNNIRILMDIDGIIDMYSVPIKKSTGVKIISWEHFNYYFHPAQRLRKLVRRYAVNKVDAIVTLTEEDKGYYEKNLSFKCPIKCIYNPVVWKQRVTEYNKKSRMILSIGRLTYQKGFDMLIEAAKIVVEKNKDIKWIILGEGEERKLLEEKVKNYGLNDNIIFVGNVNNVDEYYKDAALFVMSSRFEGLPMTLLETKPYNLPIISFKCKTGPSELIADGVNGYLIEEGNISEMASKISELMNDSERRQEFSGNANIGMDKFEIKNIMRKWCDLLDALAKP